MTVSDDGPTFLLAGDSTVAVCPATEAPMSGWGPALGARLGLRARVRNYARGGASTLSFVEDGLWQALLLDLSPGDHVLIQFGHNDQKLPELDPYGGYRDRLARFVEDVRAGGGRPVLCTSVRRRALPEAVPLLHPLADYADAVRTLAARLEVPLVDLHAATGELYASLGDEGSRALFTHFAPGVHPGYPDGVADNTHFCFTGAEAVADLVVEGLRAAGVLGDGARCPA